MMNVSWWLNTAWLLVCRRQLRSFRHATCTVADTQAAVLRRILRNNQDTEFGRRHRFHELSTPAEYQRCVPLSTWQSYEDAVQRIGEGQPGVLTRDRVLVLEPTSGSTRGEKLIPCNATLRREFQYAIGAWVADLLTQRPEVRNGCAYWSVSPAAAESRTSSGGIPIGFDDDTGWLSPVERMMMKRLLAVPSSVVQFTDLNNFRYCTLLHLVRAADLSLISVWSPTFLTALVHPLREWGDRICSDLRRGRVSLPGIEEGIPDDVVPRRRTDPGRADVLSDLLNAGNSLPELYQQVWPRLALISCWTDAGAGAYVKELQSLFPEVEFQPKGLLATEACVTFPLVNRPAAALAVRSHFFEFEEATGSGEALERPVVRMAHELEDGGIYNVIVTTGGGLYRYQLRDAVKVVDFENQCPLLRFLGRSDSSSDLVGEKLSETHVRAVLESAFAEQSVDAAFAMLVPVPGKVPGYRLYLESAVRFDVCVLSAKVESGLNQNPYYRHAVAMKQLQKLDVRVIREPGTGWAAYERWCITCGQKAGDIKPTVLETRPGVTETLDQESSKK